MIKADLHTHTVASTHAFGTWLENVESASKNGIELLGITDHGPAIKGGTTVTYFKAGERMPKIHLGVRVLFGVEANILDKNGQLDLEDNILKRLNLVFAGVHKDIGSILSREDNTKGTIAAIKNPLVQMITHPVTYKFDIDIEEVAEVACKYDKLLEINASGFYKQKDPQKLNKIIKRTAKMVKVVKSHNKKVIINSDAHTSFEIGRDKEVRERFEELGLYEEDIINNDISALKKFLGIK